MSRMSILMPVFNGERFVQATIESLIVQTFQDFELLIVDDASTDATPQILNELAQADRRVRVITNPTNLGLTKSLNIVLRLASLAQGDFVARMDADDIALPTRLEKQVAFLESHPDVGVVGTWYQFIDDSSHVIGEKHPPTQDPALRRSIIRFNPFLHSSVMIRKELLDRVYGYDERYRRAQDYDLWMRLSPLTKLANLPEVLMQKRFTTGMVSYAAEREQIKTAVTIRVAAIRRGQYPLWCVVFTLKPLLAMIFPVPVVRFLRVYLFRQKIYKRLPLQTDKIAKTHQEGWLQNFSYEKKRHHHLPDKPRKIFFVITKSEAGGAQTHVAQLTQFLVAQGHRVAIMSAPGGWLEQETNKLGARFFPNPFLANSANPLRLVKAGHCLIQAVRDFQPDILSCHSTAAGLLGRFTIRNRIPTVFTAHGWGCTQGAPTLRRVALPILERLAARFSSKIICVSQNDLRLAQRHHIAPKEKLIQIYNGVEIPHPIMKQPSDHVRIFFIGRLAPPKDPIMLIKAIQHVPELVRQKVRVTIIGDGPDRQNLESAIHDAGLDTMVELAGSLPRDKIIERLQCEADLFVLPTHWEGFPYSILEAMACGVPVIASNVGGIAEAVDATCGILVAPNDEQALQEALVSLITDSEQRRIMGEAGKEKASRIFSVQSMCQRTLVVYEEVL